MKLHFLMLPLAALFTLRASAQTPVAPQVLKKAANPTSMEPAAKAILDRAIQTYQSASALSFRQIYMVGDKRKHSTLARYSREGKFRTDSVRRQKKFTYLYDGKNVYDIAVDQYQTEPLNKGATGLFWRAGTAGELIGNMVEGKNQIADTQLSLSQLPPGDYRSDVIALGPQLIDGEMLVGVQETSFMRFDPKDKLGTHSQTRAWFGGTPFALRRMQVHMTHEGKTFTLGERITEQEFSPTFPQDTFVFNPAGLKLEQRDPTAPIFDPRLKVGTRPFPFAARDLEGRSISLDKYKGKVVLLDFWATWCGPCLEALPEVEKAYQKYHAKGFEMVGISLDEEKKDLTRFIAKRKTPWPQVFDGKGWETEIAKAYGVRAIPFVLVIGKDGKIAAVNPDGKVDAVVKAALGVRGIDGGEWFPPHK